MFFNSSKQEQDQDQVILIAGDSQPDLAALANALTAAKYRVVTARNGSEALCMAASNHPVIAILDVTMPMKNGFAVTEHLKGYEKTKSIQVILTSARRTSQADMDLGYKCGAAYYLVKPIDKPWLLETIAVLLRNPKPEAAVPESSTLSQFAKHELGHPSPG